MFFAPTERSYECYPRKRCSRSSKSLLPKEALFAIIEVVIKNYPAIRASGMTAEEAVKDLIAAYRLVVEQIVKRDRKD